MKKFYIGLIFLLILTFRLGASTPLTSPTITSISYNESNGKYKIIWSDPNPIGTVDTFCLFAVYKENSGTINHGAIKAGILSNNFFIEIDSIITTINVSNPKTFNLNHEVCYFAIEAYPPAGSTFSASSENINKDPTIGTPSNLLIKAAFDTCSEQLQLKWNYLNIWESYAVTYKYNPNPDSSWIPWYTGNNISRITFSKLQSFNYDSTINFNKNYIRDTVVYLKVVESNQDQFGNQQYWTSNITKKNTRATHGPAYLNADGTNVLNDGSVELNFTVDPASHLHKYRLFRSEKDTNKFTFLSNIDTISHSVHYIDNNVKAASTSYFYKLIAFNNCDTLKIKSNIESNIVLKITQGKTMNQLTWTPYLKFDGKLKQYDIHRTHGGKNIVIATRESNDTTYTDILDTSNIGDTWYYIEVFEDGTTNPNNHINGNAISNKIHLVDKPNYEMPQYFTPNYHGVAHFYPPSVQYSYQMIIFDRWGTKVYETKDSKPWNGKYQGVGNDVPQGVYIYYIKMTASDGRSSTESKGYFTLIIQ